MLSQEDRVPRFKGAVNALLVVLSSLLTYVALEIGYRVYIHHMIVGQVIDMIAPLYTEDPFHQFDPQIGFRYSPNATYRNLATFHNEYTINQYGFVANDLDPTPYTQEKPQEEYRIAILGDSFTIGLQNYLRWPDLLQDHLNRSQSWRSFVGGKFTRVLNFGMDGTGIVQWADVYEFAAKPFSPDLVIVNFITDDIRRNFLFRGETDLSDNVAVAKRIKENMVPLLRWYDWYPEVFAVTIGRYLGFQPRLTAAAAYNDFRYTHTEEAIEQSILALDRIRSLNPNLLILHHPLFEEMLEPDDDTTKRWPETPELVGLETKFLQAAHARKFEVANLSKRNRPPLSRLRTAALYNIPIDTHNSDYGVALYASWVFNYLMEWSQMQSNVACSNHSCAESAVPQTSPAARAEAPTSLNGCEMPAYRTKCPGANLEGADLRGRFLIMADLAGANLKGADLSDLNLWNTRLSKATLSGAKMARAFLTGADLRNANLQFADLRHAFLFRAQADGANFAGALLEGARWLNGAICGPGSIGDCLPLPPTASDVSAPLTWHLTEPPTVSKLGSKQDGLK